MTNEINYFIYFIRQYISIESFSQSHLTLQNNPIEYKRVMGPSGWMVYWWRQSACDWRRLRKCKRYFRRLHVAAISKRKLSHQLSFSWRYFWLASLTSGCRSDFVLEDTPGIKKDNCLKEREKWWWKVEWWKLWRKLRWGTCIYIKISISIRVNDSD